jgi:chemotaxis protein CheD
VRQASEGMTATTGAASGRPTVYLHAGQLAVFREPRAISTVLGSCVAVCLWDAGLGVGGMNHYLLPHRAGAGETSPRFGNVAMGKLLDELVRLGGRFAHLRAKVFGGASVLGGSPRPGTEPLGEQNVALARSLLQAAGIPIVAEDTGGSRGRRLIFQTDDGFAFVKRL